MPAEFPQPPRLPRKEWKSYSSPHDRFTPGSWRVEQHHDGPYTLIGGPVAVIGGDATGERVGFTVGRVSDFGPHGDEQTDANARAVAAVPNLVLAVRRLLWRLRWKEPTEEDRTAIAAAEELLRYVSPETA